MYILTKLYQKRRLAVVVPSVLAAMSGCSEDQQDVTTRNLQRPGPIALVCARPAAEGGSTGLPLQSCAADAEDGAVLYGFVANTSRGDVALFQTNKETERLIDLNPGSPSYGFIPVGSLPADLEATSDGCRVVTTNSGSCDLSVIDVSAVIDLTAGGGSERPSGATVARIIPHTASGPLLARPHELVFSPSSASETGDDASSARCEGPGSYRALVTFPSCNLVAEIDLATGRVLQGALLSSEGVTYTSEPVCPRECAVRSASFPSTDAGIVADATPADAAPDVADDAAPDVAPDTSVDVEQDAPDDAPVDAPGDAATTDAPADSAPADAGAEAAIAPDGAAVATDSVVEAAVPTVRPRGVLPTSLAITPEGDRIYVSSGGANFITVFELSSGKLTGDRRILLSGDNAETTVLRLSPATSTYGGPFLYAIARDRTVRVISTDLEQECETNYDLLPLDGGVPFNRAGCFVVSGSSTPGRSVLQRSAGLSFGSRVPVDVTFVKSTVPPDAGPEEVLPPKKATPLWGTFALVVASDGTVYVVDLEDFNYPGTPDDKPASWYDEGEEPSLEDGDWSCIRANPIVCKTARIGGTDWACETEDGTQVCRSPDGRWKCETAAGETDPSCTSPGLWDCEVSETDESKKKADKNARGFAASCKTSAVQELQLPHRFRNVRQGASDETYAVDAGVAKITGQGAGGVPVVVSNRDNEGLPADGITTRAPGVAAPEAWELVYERTLFERYSGQLSINADGTELQLLDRGVDFCAEGVRERQLVDGRAVRHGDILVLKGCESDDDCGLAQSCRKPVAVQTEFGLCLDDSRTDELFQQCSAFLRQPREFLITGVQQDRLVIDVLPTEPQVAVLQDSQPGCTTNADCDAGFLCALRDRLIAGSDSDKLSIRAGQCFRPGCSEDADCPAGECVRPLDGGPRVCGPVPWPLEVGGSCSSDADCAAEKARLGDSCETDRNCDPNAECRLPRSDVTEKECVSRGLRCVSFPGLKGRCARPSPCFSELVRYEIRAGQSFVIGSADRQEADPATGQCVIDEERSPLLANRVPIGPAVYPALLGPICEATTPVPRPNPCFELAQTSYSGYVDREELAGTGPQASDSAPTTIVHFANPYISFALGVSHLSVPSAPGGVDAGTGSSAAPAMPDRDLVISLSVQNGYSRLFVDGTTSQLALPHRIVSGPDNLVYVVDMGDRAGSTGTNGQVIRFGHANLKLDTSFLVK